MFKKLTVFVICIMGVQTFQAQVTYRSYNYVGVVAGQSKSAYQVLTTHGANYEGWYLGLGTGIDDYRNRTIPVFISALKEVLPKNNMFININAGTQFLWSDKERNQIWGAVAQKAYPGFFGEAGLGYRLQAGKEGQGILFGTYYSYKYFKEKFEVPQICTNPPCNTSSEYVRSQFSRWAFKVGFVF